MVFLQEELNDEDREDDVLELDKEAEVDRNKFEELSALMTGQVGLTRAGEDQTKQYRTKQSNLGPHKQTLNSYIGPNKASHVTNFESSSF